MAIFLWIFKHTFTGILMAFMKLKWYTKNIKWFVLTKVVWNKILISNFQSLFYCCRFQCLILHYGSCLYTNMTKKLQWPSENNLQELKMIGEPNLYVNVVIDRTLERLEAAEWPQSTGSLIVLRLQNIVLILSLRCHIYSDWIF